jgi:hypothetical protein
LIIDSDNGTVSKSSKKANKHKLDNKVIKDGKRTKKNSSDGVEKLNTIAELNSIDIKKFFFVARCVFKSIIKPDIKGRFYFEVIFQDQTKQIVCKFFKNLDSVIFDEFFQLLRLNSLYNVSNFKLLNSTKEITKVNNDFEGKLSKETKIVLCNDAGLEKLLEKIRFRISSIKSLRKISLGSVVDICCIIQEIQNLDMRATFMKRNIVVFDSSGYSILVTLWGEQVKCL